MSRKSSPLGEPVEFDCPDRWFVPSTTREDETHLVELSTGECSCEDWHFRKRACKHLLHLREYLYKNRHTRPDGLQRNPI